MAKYVCIMYSRLKQNRNSEGCSKFRKDDKSGKKGHNIRKNASPKWDSTRCPEE